MALRLGLNYANTGMGPAYSVMSRLGKAQPQGDYTGALNAPAGMNSGSSGGLPSRSHLPQRGYAPDTTGALNAPRIGPAAQAGVSYGPGGGGGYAPGGYAPFVPSPTAYAPQQTQNFEFEDGGMVGPGGMPVRAGLAAPGTQGGQPLDANMLEGEVNRIATQNPQLMQQLRQAIDEAIQSGELTPEELSTAIQMAQLALKNPQSWPQIRAFIIQQGIAGDQDLPQQFDSGLVSMILLIAKAAQQQMGGAGASTGQNPSMMNGGPLPQQSARQDGKVTIDAHEGEYVIPSHVVRRKGTEFFDKLLASGEEGGA